jgi:hypothetical protein
MRFSVGEDNHVSLNFIPNLGSSFPNSYYDLGVGIFLSSNVPSCKILEITVSSVLSKRSKQIAYWKDGWMASYFRNNNENDMYVYMCATNIHVQ